jgi:hypothetical protein
VITQEQIIIIARKYHDLEGMLNERTRRIWAATEARALGHGGATLVARATGIGRTTIHYGLTELSDVTMRAPIERIRWSGGGRKKLIDLDTTLRQDMRELVDPIERGDPERALRWTSKSAQKLTGELIARGHQISERSVSTLLHQEGYSLQSNRKRLEGTNHPDRDAQFRYINDSVVNQQRKKQPCISVDTKKKENVGNYKNNGQEWSKKGMPVEVNMHDFPNKELGKAAPYGVYDLIKNEGWVNVGISSDTAVFAVESIRRWWKYMGKQRYPHATELLITADSGGSNSARSRLWKVELQKLANELKMKIQVRHFPPGTSKWNKIEHRLFSMISKNWRGRPLDSLATIINLIGSTTTTTGLIVKAMLDENEYVKGIKISDSELAEVKIIKDVFHGDWNYTIIPDTG